MTTPERSVEEIVEEFNSTFPGCDQCQYGNGQGDWIEHWLTKTLQAERQRCEEMVEEERHKVKLRIDYDRRKSIPAEETVQDIYDSIELKATQPNNPK